VGGEDDDSDVTVVNITDAPLFSLADAHLVDAYLTPQILYPLRRW
jgi:hypothetical protein